jgi:murein hydrolase activator
MRGALSILVIAVAVPLLAQAPAEPDRRAEDRLKALQRESDALLAQERTLLGDLRRLEVQRDLKAEQRRQIEAELKQLTSELAATTEHLAALERAQAQQAPLLAARLAAIYKLGHAGYLRLLLSVTDPREIGRAYRAVAALAHVDRERARAHRSTVTSLQAARTDLEARRTRARRLTAEARSAQNALEAAVASRAALIAQIDARRDLNAQLMGELQAAQYKLAGAVSGLSPAATPMTMLPIGPFKGALEWPAAGQVTARFGRSPATRYGTAIVRNGVEIAAGTGGPARAIHAGTVAYAAPFTGFGNLVILDHGQRAYTLYGYLASIDVVKGAQVERGQSIGSIGQSPTGQPALYFELRIDGKAVDPLQWLKARP